jgi:AcrR family transcriptional regulator
LKRKAKHVTHRQRLTRSERKKQILHASIELFSEKGFSADTRALARQLGVTQPLIFHHFGTKRSLIEEVYREVFLRQWKSQWLSLLDQSETPLRDRLIGFYVSYSRQINRKHFVRIFMFSGLHGVNLPQRHLQKVRHEIFERVIGSLRLHFQSPDIRSLPILEDELELVWALHAAIFYLGVRRWVHRVHPPRDMDHVVVGLVDSFLASYDHLWRRRSEETSTKAARIGDSRVRRKQLRSKVAKNGTAPKVLTKDESAGGSNDNSE